MSSYLERAGANDPHRQHLLALTLDLASKLPENLDHARFVVDRLAWVIENFLACGPTNLLQRPHLAGEEGKVVRLVPGVEPIQAAPVKPL